MNQNQKPDSETRNSWHDDSSNWKFGIFYYNKADPRIFPPKRLAMLGWTVNFANPISYLSAIGLIVLIYCVSEYLK
ncbi:MAG: hypothetical protein HYZ54_06845 [Ignavibacteriae bacterium]|nr:hypothetical protein [Ignavibacteriota bacterium]